MKTIKTTIAILSIAIFSISCSKPEDVAVGPVGPVGATGTANVIYSNWASAPSATAATIDGTNGNTTSIAVSQLSQDILDKGTVLVYGKFSTTVFPLPYVSYAGGSANTLTFFPELNNIKLFRFKHDGSGGVSIPTSLLFRYILIPGGVSAKANQPNYKVMSYSEVCQQLNIRE
jgi:hypothetical protein